MWSSSRAIFFVGSSAFFINCDPSIFIVAIAVFFVWCFDATYGAYGIYCCCTCLSVLKDIKWQKATWCIFLSEHTADFLCSDINVHNIFKLSIAAVTALVFVSTQVGSDISACFHLTIHDRTRERTMTKLTVKSWCILCNVMIMILLLLLLLLFMW